MISLTWKSYRKWEEVWEMATHLANECIWMNMQFGCGLKNCSDFSEDKCSLSCRRNRLRKCFGSLSQGGKSFLSDQPVTLKTHGWDSGCVFLKIAQKVSSGVELTRSSAPPCCRRCKVIIGHFRALNNWHTDWWSLSHLLEEQSVAIGTNFPKITQLFYTHVESK